jgi:hypothetical protein
MNLYLIYVVSFIVMWCSYCISLCYKILRYVLITYIAYHRFIVALLTHV